jgi:serine/threonine-protein kinase HipA
MPFRPVLLKVPQRGDDQWQRLEHLYCQLARACGITVPDTWLLTASDSSLVHFAIARFDITADGARLHTHTLAGLKGESYTQARYDYRDILRITADLTRDARDVGEMYRRMVFNYLANNRDDHAKNFSFIMNAEGVWHVSPAYDLGFSPGENGLHASSANGKRRNLELRDFAVIAEDFDIRGYREIVTRTSEVLQAFESLSLAAGVSKKKSALIAERIRENRHRVKKS